MLITGRNEQINDIINKIKKKFTISKCNHVDYLLGIKIELDNHIYSISQEQLIEYILQKFNIKNTRKIKTPCTGDDKNLEEDKPFDKTTYKCCWCFNLLRKMHKTRQFICCSKGFQELRKSKIFRLEKGNEYFKIL